MLKAFYRSIFERHDHVPAITEPARLSSSLMILDLALHSGCDRLKDNGKGQDDVGDQADLTQVEIVPARHVEIEADTGCPGCGTHHDRGSEIHFETQESPG